MIAPKKSRVGRKPTLEGAWLTLCNHAGGIKELAEAIGVAPSTLWRWNNGEAEISPRVARDVRAYAKRHGLACPVDVG